MSFFLFISNNLIPIFYTELLMSKIYLCGLFITSKCCKKMFCSMLTITNKPVRKRSVTITLPEGIKDEETSSDVVELAFKKRTK